MSGGVGNEILRNRIIGHERAAVILENSEDLAAVGNAFIDNVFADNHVEFLNTSADRAPASANCTSSDLVTSAPS